MIRFLVALAALAGVLAVGAAAAACSTGGPGTGTNGKAVHLVAAESFWGSIAAQVGGSQVSVTSIIRDPNADPHEYEPTTPDARTVADAQYVIFNGAGYDPWMDKLLRANPSPSRVALDVAELLGKKAGDNPHFWYNPDYVVAVVGKIRADLKSIDPANAAAFDLAAQQFLDTQLKQYRELINSIKTRYGGTPVGATEGIFVYLAQALGLDLVTPGSYMEAVSEGADISAADQAMVERQVDQGQIKVLVYNSQNTPPNIKSLLERARAQGIPVATITETPAPADVAFQEWQVKQLQRIADALKQATGR